MSSEGRTRMGPWGTVTAGRGLRKGSAPHTRRAARKAKASAGAHGTDTQWLPEGPFPGFALPDNLSEKHYCSQRARRDLWSWNQCATALERISEILWFSGFFEKSV